MDDDGPLELTPTCLLSTLMEITRKQTSVGLRSTFEEIKNSNVPDAVNFIMRDQQPPPSEEQATRILLAASFQYVLWTSNLALTSLDYVRIAQDLLYAEHGPWEAMCVNIANKWVRRLLSRRRFEHHYRKKSNVRNPMNNADNRG